MATFLYPRFLRAFLTATVVASLLALTLPLADRAQGETVTPSCPTVPVALSNDSFESPVVNAKERRTIDGSAVTGWIGSGDNGKVTLLASGWTDITAAVGRQFAQLSGSPSRLSQDVATVPGTSLAWSLSHRAVNGSTSMRVLIGSPGSAGKEQAVLTDSTTWTRHGGTYRVPDGQTITRITLLPADGSAPDANLVDEVSFGTAACIVAHISLTPTTPIAVEGIVTQVAVLRNTGGTPTKDVVLGVVLTKTTEYVEDSANPSGIYGLTPDTLLIRPVGALGVPGVILPTESVVVTWQQRILPEASNSVITIPSTVTVVDAFDTKSVTPEENTTVVVRPSSDIQVSQQFTPSLVASGAATTLSFTVRNDGPSDASGVTVTEELPTGAVLNGALSGGCALSARTMTCTIGALANGDSRTFEIALTAPTTSTSLVARSSLQARSNGTDPSGDNNRSVEALSVAPPSIPTLEANLSPSQVIATAGSVATVSVDVMNISAAAGLAPLTVTGSFPEGFTPLYVVGTPAVGATAPVCTSAPAVCTFLSMAAGASARVEFRGVIDSRLADGTSFLGSVQTAGIGALSLTTPVVFSVNAQSTLAIDERIVGPMSSGSPITKLVTIVNGGPSVALESSVFVPLPNEATSINTPANCTKAFGGLGCTLGVIDSGAFASTAISFELPATGGTIRDGARAATTTPMPNPVVDRYSRTEFVGPVSDLFVKVTGIDPATNVGDAVSFMIDVTNRGPGEASSVQVLTDPKLTGLRFDSALPERGEWNPNIALWEIPTLASGATARLRIEATGTRTSSSSLSVLARSSNPDIAAIDNTAIAPLDVLASASPDTKSSGGWLMPVLLGIGVLVFIAACVYLFLQWRKNKS